jgi:hypothetical protein
MPDRLSELVRQRALVSEHLAWLDREIASAAAVGNPPAAAATEPAISAVAAPVTQPAENLSVAMATPARSGNPTGDVAAEAETLFDQYRVTTAALKQDVRKGCFLYFVGAFVVLGIVIVVLYFAIGTR